MEIYWVIILVVIGAFLTNHIVIGIIKGLYRYSMINKYCYDYYHQNEMDFFGKLRHNISRATFKSATLYVSIGLTAIESLVFLFLKYS